MGFWPITNRDEGKVPQEMPWLVKPEFNGEDLEDRIRDTLEKTADAICDYIRKHEMRWDKTEVIQLVTYMHFGIILPAPDPEEEGE